MMIIARLLLLFQLCSLLFCQKQNKKSRPLRDERTFKIQNDRAYLGIGSENQMVNGRECGMYVVCGDDV
jgi:hypothetical protein